MYYLFSYLNSQMSYFIIIFICMILYFILLIIFNNDKLAKHNNGRWRITLIEVIITDKESLLSFDLKGGFLNVHQWRYFSITEMNMMQMNNGGAFQDSWCFLVTLSVKCSGERWIVSGIELYNMPYSLQVISDQGGDKAAAFFYLQYNIFLM